MVFIDIVFYISPVLHSAVVPLAMCSVSCLCRLHLLLQVVSLGIVGVFSILKDVWKTNPDLCLQVLEQFLNILQGQNPAGLRNEPAEATG